MKCVANKNKKYVKLEDLFQNIKLKHNIYIGINCVPLFTLMHHIWIKFFENLEEIK